jgi:ribosomal protein S18 acetylase RimI-like enzyme
MLQKSPSYRRATVADLSLICELGQVVNHLHHEAWPQIFASTPDRAGEEAHWLKSLREESAATFLAFLDGAVVGFITVQLLRESHCLLQPVCFARVGTICVLEGMRGRGIGRTLMEHVEQWAVTRGAMEIRLEVWKFNTSAVALYEELGYEIRSFSMSKSIRPDVG